MSGVTYPLPSEVLSIPLPEREPTLAPAPHREGDAPAAGALWLPEGDQPGVAALVCFDAKNRGRINERYEADVRYHNVVADYNYTNPELARMAGFLGIRSFQAAYNPRTNSQRYEYYTEFPSGEQANQKIEQLNSVMETMPEAAGQLPLPLVESFPGGEYPAVTFLQSFMRGRYLVADGRGDQRVRNSLRETPAHLAFHDAVIHLPATLLHGKSYTEDAVTAIRKTFRESRTDTYRPLPQGLRTPYELGKKAEQLDGVTSANTLGYIATAGILAEDAFEPPYSKLVELDRSPTAVALPKLRQYAQETATRMQTISKALDIIGSTE